MSKAVIWLGIVIIIVLLTLPGCRATRLYSIDCTGLPLLLDETFFPPGAQAGEPVSPLPDGPLNSAGNTIYLGRGIAVLDIYPYSSNRRASAEFQQQFKDPVFLTATSPDSWKVPDELADFSSIADEFALACGHQNSIPMCRVIARYEGYFVYLNVHTYADEFTYSDLRNVLNAMESRIEQCLEDSQ